MSAIRPDLLPTTEELAAIRAVAVGRRPADLIVRGGRVLHVHTGEFRPGDVVVCGRHIAAVTPVGRMQADTVIDAAGRWVTPTFIDAHLHIEYTMLTPGELARLIVPRGTVTVLTDADCMANVAGLPGIELMGTTSAPLRIFHQITPTTPPFAGLVRGGAAIDEQEVLDRLAAPRTVTLGEGNPFDYSTVATHRFRTALVNGRRITGHSGRQSDELLWGYLAAGVGDDHNAATLPEVIDRVRLGAMITVMSGSMNDNINAIFADPAAVRPYLGHMCFCADDKHVLDLSGGALAVSSNCPDVNIAAVGTSDADIACAVQALAGQRGGFVAVRDGVVLASVPLPIGGLMDDEPWEVTAGRLADAHAAAEGLGCAIRSPYMVLSFVGLAAVPDFGLTDLGLVDVLRQEFAPLLLQDGDGRVMACRCARHDQPVHALAQTWAVRR